MKMTASFLAGCVCLYACREEVAAPIVRLHSLMVDCKTCRCLKTLSTRPERKVRMQKSLANSVDNDLDFKTKT